MLTKEKQKWIVLEKYQQPFYGEEMTSTPITTLTNALNVERNSTRQTCESGNCGTKMFSVIENLQRGDSFFIA